MSCGRAVGDLLLNSIAVVVVLLCKMEFLAFYIALMKLADLCIRTKAFSTDRVPGGDIFRMKILTHR
jgi:hypothetical protein